MNKKQTYIGLANPKSPDNVASILRAVSCFNVDAVFYTGTRYDKAKAFSGDTKKVHQSKPPIYSNNLYDTLPDKAISVAVELVEGATPLMHFEHPDNAYYIFGPEDGTLDKELLTWCRHVIYIPTFSCMNLAAAVNVVLYDRMLKDPDIQFGDEFIKAARDTNNNTSLIDKDDKET